MDQVAMTCPYPVGRMVTRPTPHQVDEVRLSILVISRL